MLGLIWIQTVWLDLMVFLKDIFEKAYFENKSADDKNQLTLLMKVELLWVGFVIVVFTGHIHFTVKP